MKVELIGCVVSLKRVLRINEGIVCKVGELFVIITMLFPC